jgi:membrane associated rhomboid family serine protease
MGESDRYIEYKNKKQRFTLGQQDNAIVNLIVVNIVVFMLLLVMQVIYYLFEIDKTTYQKQVVEYFTLSASFDTLFHRPWTLLVYMFSNVGVLELLGNMIWLYSFGSLLQNQTSNKTIFPVFIYGGLVGAIVY